MKAIPTPYGDDELCSLGVRDLAALYRAGSLSPVETTRAVLDRIERLNPKLNAYLCVTSDSAMAAARSAELDLRSGIDLGPLHGVPFSVKDIINVAGTKTTAASRVLQDAPADEEDATVVKRMRAAGAILVGKVNLHEFAYGAPDPDSPFGKVQNPRRVGHQAGSSSSGSGAAVAAGLGVISVGTDTGGSIRHPASLCGVVGLKPTYGLVPVTGVVPLSVNLDHVGPLGRSVEDVAAALAVMAGHDPKDPRSELVPVHNYLDAIDVSVRRLRIGVPTNDFYKLGHPAMLNVTEAARKCLLEMGLQAVPLELPGAEEANQLCDILSTVDLWSYHRRHGGREMLYGQEFWARAERGREVTAVDYALARERQLELGRMWRSLLERVDLLVLPGNIAGAALHGQTTVEINGETHPVRMIGSRYTRAANITGLPAISIPVGETSERLPIAVQLVGPPFGERRLLAVAHSLEKALGNLTQSWGIQPRES